MVARAEQWADPGSDDDRDASRLVFRIPSPASPALRYYITSRTPEPASSWRFNLDDTDPAPAAADTNRLTAVSTSSMPTDESQHADPIIALGERIVAELGDPRTNNTLTRWLSHHTARLIHEADTARQTGAPDADNRETKAREAILQLWQARATWPGGWPPPARPRSRGCWTTSQPRRRERLVPADSPGAPPRRALPRYGRTRRPNLR